MRHERKKHMNFIEFLSWMFVHRGKKRTSDYFWETCWLFSSHIFLILFFPCVRRNLSYMISEFRAQFSYSHIDQYSYYTFFLLFLRSQNMNRTKCVCECYVEHNNIVVYIYCFYPSTTSSPSSH